MVYGSCLFIFWLVFGVFLVTLAPAVTVGDAGEFIATSNILGIAHPPGYPLFSLLGKGAIVLFPFGNCGYRLNILCAIFGGLAASLMFVGSKKYFSSKISRLISIFGIFSGILWQMCIQTEVFSLLLLFTVILFWLNEITGRIANLEVFLFGLGMTNHQLIAFAYLPLFFQRLKLVWQKKYFQYLFLAGFLFLLGFSLNLFLLIRSQKSPVLNWTGAQNFSKLWRIITRADYGSFALTVGEKLPYNFYYLSRQFFRFLKILKRQVGYLSLFLGIAGVVLNWKSFGKKVTAIIFLTGPLFFFLANLPFNPEAEGVLERFLVIPAFFLFLGVAGAAEKIKFPFFRIILLLLLLGTLLKRFPQLNWRNNFLAVDYGRNVLKTVEPNGVMFIDGGDDTFYSVAFWQLTAKFRPDIEVHDRGGLVFPNIYGSDFRMLPKAEKEARRLLKEQAIAFHLKKPVYYFTFRPDIWPGRILANSGFAYYYSAVLRADAYPCYSRRNVYDFKFFDYRSLALIPIYDYFEPAVRTDLKNISLTLKKHRLIEWYRKNFYIFLSSQAYDFYQKQNYLQAKRIYDFLVENFPPGKEISDALLNAGVCAEKIGQKNVARQYYQKALEFDENNPRIYYNLAVLDWGSNWSEVVKNLRRAIELSPRDSQIQKYLLIAEQKLKK